MIIPKAFQYIPCYGLSLPTATRKSAIVISIHPMLRFITTGYGDFILKAGFQYIPCYGLSLTFLDSTPNMFHFNTSHVTVYLAPKVPHSADNGFQYIPCYGLSKGECCKVVVISPFQYIPCYGLSALGAGLREPPLYFNTSHVTVYQTEASKEFRSSHISIHPMLRFIKRNSMETPSTASISIHPMLRFILKFKAMQNVFHTISIHPMLRFIDILRTYMKEYIEFQYIPCYGLSSARQMERYFSKISIHPMLRFISIGVLNINLASLYFNTSHVTVYHLIPPADQSL